MSNLLAIPVYFIPYLDHVLAISPSTASNDHSFVRVADHQMLSQTSCLQYAFDNSEPFRPYDESRYHYYFTPIDIKPTQLSTQWWYYKPRILIYKCPAIFVLIFTDLLARDIDIRYIDNRHQSTHCIRNNKRAIPKLLTSDTEISHFLF